MAKIKEGTTINKKLQGEKSSRSKKDDREVYRVSVTGNPYDEISWGWEDQTQRGKKRAFCFYRKDREIARFTNIKMGDCFDLLYSKKHDRFEPRKVKLPHQQNDLIMWLFDVPVALRCDSGEEYEATRLESESKIANSPYRTWEFGGAAYGFTFVQEDKKSEIKPLAAWVNPRCADGQLVEVILADANLRQFLGYEDACVKEIVKFRFGLSSRDLKAVGL